MTKSIQTIAARLGSGLIMSAASVATRGSTSGLVLCPPCLRAEANTCEPRELLGTVAQTGAALQRGLIVLVATLSLLNGLPTRALANCNPAAGTVINYANLANYEDCFSDGIQYLWSQTSSWKIPEDAEIHVGKPHQWILPQPYIDATEKFNGRARLAKQSDGSYRLENYTAGIPFAIPSGPGKALQIVTNATYRMTGYAAAALAEVGAGPAPHDVRDDRGNWPAETVDCVYRQLDFNWEPGIPQNDPRSAGAWHSEWLMIEASAQMRYTALRTIHWQDNLRDEDVYALVPAQHRSLRLPAAATCSSIGGGDADPGDIAVGKYTAELIREQPLLTRVEMNPLFAGKFPEEYDGALGWPKPSWGDWETRNVYVVDVRMISPPGTDRCDGKRTMYLDRQYYQTLAEDTYDRSMQLTRVAWIGLESGRLDQYGEQMGFGGAIEIYWDVQRDAYWRAGHGKWPRS